MLFTTRRDVLCCARDIWSRDVTFTRTLAVLLCLSLDSLSVFSENEKFPVDNIGSDVDRDLTHSPIETKIL